MKELRYLLFSNEELYLALLSWLRVRNAELSLAFLKRLTINNLGKPDITIDYVNNKGIELAHRFDDQDVVSALILFCRENHIPLSARAAKSLEIHDGSIGLLCKLSPKSHGDHTFDGSPGQFVKEFNNPQARKSTAVARHSRVSGLKPVKVSED